MQNSNSGLIRVVFAMPSTITASRLRESLSVRPGISIIGHAKDLTETFNLIETHNPNIVVLAPEFTTVPEFEIMVGLFRAMNIRWVSVESRANRSPEPTNAALARSGLFSVSLSGSPGELEQHIKSICHFSRPAKIASPEDTRQPSMSFRKLVLIGSSTGGIDALINILSKYPKNCPPTAIVQHTGEGFTGSLIDLLNRSSAANVVRAEDNMEIRPGMVCVAGSRKGHLTLHPRKPYRCVLKDAPPVSGHRPSVDAMFESAIPIAKDIVGVILTGMGQDGAAGLVKLRQNGATTIGQDRSSSVIYGMPRVAFEMGAVEQQLPITAIASQVLKRAAIVTKANNLR